MNIAFVSTAHLHVDMFLRGLRFLLGDKSAYAIWDDDRERGKFVADKEAAKFFPELDSMLQDTSIDGFAICSENKKLLPLLERVLPMGKPVFCEKPLAVGLGDLHRLITVVDAYRAPVVSGYFQPYLGDLKAIRELVTSGELGEIKSVRYANTRPAVEKRWFDRQGAEWFVDPSLAGGGGFLDLGSHAVHALCLIFGQITEVWAQIENRSGVYPAVDDFGEARLKFESGLTATIEAGWLQSGSLEGIEIIGSQKSVWKAPAGYRVGSRVDDGQEEPLNVVEDDPVRMDRLLAAIRGQLTQGELKRDLKGCFDTVQVLHAAYRSSGEGNWVSVK
ncbi:Gfo/Idh/MocA family oxidoreductase [Puniceicoccaceae bacterium K14]|nr:Gfo/Idh/MocA family oxidoreductase [Puniceicoccaceae bacterium K14]